MPKKIRQNWWEAGDDQIHQSVCDAFKRIDSAQVSRRQKNAYFLGFYEGRRDLMTLDGTQWAKPSDIIYDEESRENVLKSAIDAAVAKISTNRPRLVCLTNAGDYRLQQLAKKRTLLIEGVLADQKAYKTGRLVCKDGMIWDAGLFKIFPDYQRKKVIIERVLVDEVAVDTLDGKYGSPRSMFQTQTISRHVLRAMWPEHLSAIDGARLIRPSSNTDDPLDDPVSVLEAWHLPSAPDCEDGKCVICTRYISSAV